MKASRVWLALAVGGGLVAALAPAGRSAAFPPYLDAWKARYPASTLPQRMSSITGSQCTVCHLPAGFSTEGTCYRLAIRDRLNLGMSIGQAIDTVDGLDSDNDGVPNGVEILTLRRDNPQHRGYHPGLIGPTGTSPCGPSPGLPITGQPETPPCYADCNLDGALNLADFGCFQTKFALADPYADCNLDGTLNLADFGCFQTRFAVGCP
jgi:hypothetical protein